MPVQGSTAPVLSCEAQSTECSGTSAMHSHGLNPDMLLGTWAHVVSLCSHIHVKETVLRGFLFLSVCTADAMIDRGALQWVSQVLKNGGPDRGREHERPQACKEGSRKKRSRESDILVSSTGNFNVICPNVFFRLAGHFDNVEPIRQTRRAQ